MTDEARPEAGTGAGALLLALKDAGVDYLFANAGTDFPPLIEAMARLPAEAIPVPLTMPHETAAIGMAHGYWLATGRAQAIMVHVNVGLANAVMGIINTASDDVPVLVMSGRTPITEAGRPGHRVTPIHYGQEMFDQTSLVRDLVKYDYELRYPEQAAELVGRALTIARTAPTGPVYLSLPREPLAEDLPAGWRAPRQPAPTSPAAPDPGAIETLAGWIRAAERPMILCQRGDPEGRLGPALSRLANAHGIAVISPFLLNNVLADADPAFQGFAPPLVEETDCLIVLDSHIPWMAAGKTPPATARIAHVGPDPHFARMPVRGYRSDLAIASDPVLAVEALEAALGTPSQAAAARNEAHAGINAARRARLRETAEAGAGSPMTTEWMSQCIAEVMDEDAMVFSDLGILYQHMDAKAPNRVFSGPHSGGLGWAVTAALGAQLADRDRLCIAATGDGSYIFANPVACHQIAEALDLPILTIVKNNASWNAVRRSVLTSYPDGHAVKANEMPLTSLRPQPDFCAIAAASRAHTERVTDGTELPAALRRAIRVIREERRQVLLDVEVALSDAH
ncbi:thiamine pyrophosphate-requiring protein [Rhodobacterales bacterium HKCCE3408]|nr:thiamine pyrophosphate-requiring protein [Rhodobacterales bacterium HKCCE3408]